MPFPEKLLNEGESMVIDTHPHWWTFVPAVLQLVLAIAVAVVAATKIDNDIVNYIGIALILFTTVRLGWVYLQWFTTDFVLTSDRLITRSGVLSRHTREIPIERINDLACHQSIFERLIGSGDLLVESGGERGQQTFSNVSEPFEVQNTIHRTMESAQVAGQTVRSPVDSVPEQIEKLDELRQRGVISDAEFQDKKRKLLDRL
ncbi:MAG: PH domain-containing protein [Acidimicrobiales bacterium]|nr:PH domain-containing protein [Acidimicrobiales bacterium]